MTITKLTPDGSTSIFFKNNIVEEMWTDFTGDGDINLILIIKEKHLADALYQRSQDMCFNDVDEVTSSGETFLMFNNMIKNSYKFSIKY